MKSVCQLRTITGLPCDRCKYNGECKAYKKKGGKENAKKQKKSGNRKRNNSDQ